MIYQCGHGLSSFDRAVSTVRFSLQVSGTDGAPRSTVPAGCGGASTRTALPFTLTLLRGVLGAVPLPGQGAAPRLPARLWWTARHGYHASRCQAATQALAAASDSSLHLVKQRAWAHSCSSVSKCWRIGKSSRTKMLNLSRTFGPVMKP